MGFHQVSFFCSSLSLLLSLLLSSLSPSLSLSQHLIPKTTSPHLLPRQLLHVTKPRPYPYPSSSSSSSTSTTTTYNTINGDHMITMNEKKNRRKKKRRRERNGDYDVGVFAAMLPRGFVPPSDSSWCHNDAPTSIDFVCGDYYYSSKP